MSAYDQLLRLYEGWRCLTEAESSAIAAAEWTRLAACQKAKHTLQAQISQASLQLETELQCRPQHRPRIERELRAIVQTLISLEQGNQETLARQQQRAREKESELQQARRNLRHLQQAYASSPTPAWQSYS
jgi:hypothetical protein